MFGPSLGALSGSLCVSKNKPATPIDIAALHKEGICLFDRHFYHPILLVVERMSCIKNYRIFIFFIISKPLKSFTSVL